MNNGELNLASLSHLFVNENAAREFVERQRWPDGPVCPHCQSKNVYKLTAKPGSKNPVPPGVYKCECREKFTVRIGTIYEDSKLPLSKWLMAFHLMTSSKKGVSSHQIARELGITVKSAWFLTHRIREAMKKQPVAGLLQGIVEVDETYIGGKPRKGDGKKHKRGRGTPKQPVLVLVERDGNAWVKPIGNTTSKTLKNEIAVHVAKEAVIMTDELHSYFGLDRRFARHET